MRISIFLDGANFFFMQKEMKWHVSPKKIIDYISTKGEVVDAFYYTGQDAPPEVNQQKYLDALPDMGYSLVTKQIKDIYDTKTGKTKRKANLDIEIVLDMFNTIDNYDMAVLISGDGDFERPLQLLRARGKQLLVLATEGFIARELRHTVGKHYIDLQSIRTEIEK